jgi:hypothetical protein
MHITSAANDGTEVRYNHQCRALLKANYFVAAARLAGQFGMGSERSLFLVFFASLDDDTACVDRVWAKYWP